MKSSSTSHSNIDRKRNVSSRVNTTGEIVSFSRIANNQRQNRALYLDTFNLIMNNKSPKDMVYAETVNYIHTKLINSPFIAGNKGDIHALIRNKLNNLFDAKMNFEMEGSQHSNTNPNKNRRQFLAANFLKHSERQTCYVCNQSLMTGECTPHVEHIIRILPLYLLMGHIPYGENSIFQHAIKESHRLCNLLKASISLLEYRIEKSGKIMAELDNAKILELATVIYNSSESVGTRKMNENYYFRDTSDRRQPVILKNVPIPWNTGFIQKTVGRKITLGNATEYNTIKQFTTIDKIAENLTQEIMSLKEAINAEKDIDIFAFKDNLDMLADEIKLQFKEEQPTNRDTSRKSYNRMTYKSKSSKSSKSNTTRSKRT